MMPDRPSLEADEMESIGSSLVPREGWVVMHLFYHLEYATWDLLGGDIQRKSKTDLTQLVQEIRAQQETQLLTFGMVSPKADLGFMLLTPDLHMAHAFEKQLNLSLGPEILTPVYSYLSMTERDAYCLTEAQYRKRLMAEDGLEPGAEELEDRVEAFQARREREQEQRLHPNLPEWPIFCFYPMSRRRSGEDNWYRLPFTERQKLMGGQARVERRWRGKVLQLVTGSMGIDDAECGVSLFGQDLTDVKDMASEMRFDEVGSRFGEYGEFYIGLQLSLDELFERLDL